MATQIIDFSNLEANPPQNGETFTSNVIECGGYDVLKIAIYADQDATCYADFSIDNSNLYWDSQVSFQLKANTNELKPFNVMRRFCRIRIVSAGNMTVCRMQVILGNVNLLTSNLNSIVQRDAPANVIRATDFNLLLAEGLYENTTSTIKDGFITGLGNGAIDVDVWTSGGTYTGFPTAATEEGQIVVAGADTGTVWYSYLESSTSTDYVFASKAVAGAGSYDLGHNIWRCNFMYFVSTSSTGFNAGLISIRWKTTTTVIFNTIVAGFSQSYNAAYTVPYGSSVYLDRINGSVRGSASGSIDGYFWYRPFNESPRLRFPYELQFGNLYFDDIDYLVKIPERVDIMPRLKNTSTNGLTGKVAYRIVKIKS